MDFNQSSYTLEFFNFTPEHISVERDQLVKSIINRAIETTIKKIETPRTSALLTQQKGNVIGLMKDACQKKLDALRELDRRTFELPAHVLLIKDFELEQPFSSAEEQAKNAQLEELKLRYGQNMAMLAELEAEQEKYTAIEALIETEISMHELIYEACDNSDLQNMYKFAQRLAKDEL